MRKTVRIRVTRKHIEEGQPGNEFACPIALALEERFPEAFSVEVADRYVEIDMPGRRVLKYRHDGTDFINDFDNGEDVNTRFVRLTEGQEETY